MRGRPLVELRDRLLELREPLLFVAACGQLLALKWPRRSFVVWVVLRSVRIDAGEKSVLEECGRCGIAGRDGVLPGVFSWQLCGLCELGVCGGGESLEELLRVARLHGPARCVGRCGCNVL